MNLINAKYGNAPGLKAYTHVSDQFGPFATQNIPATVSEAPYILDGLLMNEAGKNIREQYAPSRNIAVQYPVGQWIPVASLTTSLLSHRFWPTGSSRASETCSQNVCMSLIRAAFQKN